MVKNVGNLWVASDSPDIKDLEEQIADQENQMDDMQLKIDKQEQLIHHQRQRIFQQQELILTLEEEVDRTSEMMQNQLKFGDRVLKILHDMGTQVKRVQEILKAMLVTDQLAENTSTAEPTNNVETRK